MNLVGRLASAKSSIQNAMQKATTAVGFKSTMTTIRKNEFASMGLPLGAQNYGKIVGKRSYSIIGKVVSNIVFPPVNIKMNSELVVDKGRYSISLPQVKNRGCA